MNLISKLHPPIISVIIPFYGIVKDLSVCLQGILKQKFNKFYEVIVVSSVKELEIKQVINDFPDVKFIFSDSVLFPGEARNIGVKNSKSNLLAFIDADCLPEPDWLLEIYTRLIKDAEVVIGPILNLYPIHPVASVDNLLQFPDFQKYRPSNSISHFPACNLGITKELFLKSDGFPEDVITGEDIIFSQNVLKLCEDKIIFNKRLIVKHSGRRNLKSFVKHNEILGYYRGYLRLKISNKENKIRSSILYSLFFGLKRLFYISFRTFQWNPAGTLRITIYFPIFILGLLAWAKGFNEGNKKHFKEKD